MEGIRVVNELLSEENYEEWCIQVKTYLMGRDLWDVVEADEPAHEDEPRAKAWRQNNALAFHAIMTSCGMRHAFRAIKEKSSAKHAWAALADKYGPKSEEHDITHSGNADLKESEIKEYSKINEHSEPESYFAPWRENLVNPNEEDDDEHKVIEEKSNSPNNTNNGASGSSITTPDVRASAENFRQYEPLFKAVTCGDWDTARGFLDTHPEAVSVRDPGTGKNALHLAIAKGHLNVVEKLVEWMSEKQVEMMVDDGLTVLAAAIETKKAPIVECLISKNRKLLSIPHCYYGLPVQQAVFSGQTQMARYLYSLTRIQDLNGRSGSDFLTHCLFAKQLDIALHLMERLPHLAITKSFYTSPVFVLSLVEVFPSGCSLSFCQKWIYDWIRTPDFGTNHIHLDIKKLEKHSSDRKDLTFFTRYKKMLWSLMRRMGSYLLQLFGIKKLYEIKLVHVQIIELLNRMCKVIKTTSDEHRLEDAGVAFAIAEAAKKGNVEFITGVVEAKPQLLRHGVSTVAIHYAIESRHAKTFSLLYGLQSKVERQLDRLTNASLNKAAKIAPSRLLNRIPGAALQMQRELQWFKEVLRIASPLDRESTYQLDQKPRDTFTESHKDLVVAGEKWMKETSTSCTVVGALIITITFAAAFTFPGGNDQDSGFPMFANMKLFRVFTLSNAIALISSTTSVLVFLGILTSRYAEEDFLRSLPTKLIVGLSTLLFSIAAMIVAFCVGLSVMFHKQSWIVTPSVSLASIPVALFVWMQFPLLRDMFISTYGPTVF